MAAGKKDEKPKNQQANNEKDEKPDDEAVAAAKQEKKQKIRKILLFVGLGLLLVGVSVGATFFAVNHFMHKEAKAETAEAGQTTSADSDPKAASAASESSSSAEPLKPAIYKTLKPNFMVNYDVNGRQRFLQAELTIMYRDEAVATVIETHMPEVRNGLVLLLSNQNFDELLTVEGKEKLREAALATVREVVDKESLAASEKDKEKEKEKEKEKDKSKENSKQAAPNVEQILFTSFVMQ